MINESRELIAARDHLQRAERDLLSDDGAYHVTEGLYLLETIASTNNDESATALRLGETYVSRFAAAIRAAIEPADVPEPTLEKLLKTVQMLEHVQTGDRDDLQALRIAVAKRLVDRYFEGYSDQEKQAQISLLLARIREQ